MYLPLRSFHFPSADPCRHQTHSCLAACLSHSSFCLCETQKFRGFITTIWMSSEQASTFTDGHWQLLTTNLAQHSTPKQESWENQESETGRLLPMLNGRQKPGQKVGNQ